MINCSKTQNPVILQMAIFKNQKIKTNKEVRLLIILN
jgi:hypothetical protein